MDIQNFSSFLVTKLLLSPPRRFTFLEMHINRIGITIKYIKNSKTLDLTLIFLKLLLQGTPFPLLPTRVQRMHLFCLRSVTSHLSANSNCMFHTNISIVVYCLHATRCQFPFLEMVGVYLNNIENVRIHEVRIGYLYLGIRCI